MSKKRSARHKARAAKRDQPAAGSKARVSLGDWRTSVPGSGSDATRVGGGLLLIVAVAVLAWQSIALRTESLPDDYANMSATALSPVYSKFAYGLAYDGVFPIASRQLEEGKHYTADEFHLLLDEQPLEIVNDIEGRMNIDSMGSLLFVPSILLRPGEPPSVVPVMAVLFLASLVCLLVSSWASRCFILGVALVLLLGSHPFQLYETYQSRYESGNAHSLVITATIFLIALYLPLLMRRKPHALYTWALACTIPLWLTALKEVRAEGTFLLLPPLVVHALLAHSQIRIRLAQAVTFLAMLWLYGMLWQAFFTHEHQRAYYFVEANGGYPMEQIRSHHTLWHPILLGTSDFDDKHDLQWSDGLMWRAFVAEHNKENLYDMIPGFDGRYRSTAPRLAGYEDFIRDRFFGYVQEDPLWYIRILGKRVIRLLTEVAPVCISVGGSRVPVPFPSWLILPLLGVLIWIRNWPMLLLLLFSVPASATAMLIYSGAGTPYFSVYAQVAAAIVASALVVLLGPAIRAKLPAAATRLVASENQMPWLSRHGWLLATGALGVPAVCVAGLLLGRLCTPAALGAPVERELATWIQEQIPTSEKFVGTGDIWHSKLPAHDYGNLIPQEWKYYDAAEDAQWQRSLMGLYQLRYHLFEPYEAYEKLYPPELTKWAHAEGIRYLIHNQRIHDQPLPFSIRYQAGDYVLYDLAESTPLELLAVDQAIKAAVPAGTVVGDGLVAVADTVARLSSRESRELFAYQPTFPKGAQPSLLQCLKQRQLWATALWPVILRDAGVRYLYGTETWLKHVAASLPKLVEHKQVHVLADQSANGHRRVLLEIATKPSGLELNMFDQDYENEIVFEAVLTLYTRGFARPGLCVIPTSGLGSSLNLPSHCVRLDQISEDEGVLAWVLSEGPRVWNGKPVGFALLNDEEHEQLVALRQASNPRALPTHVWKSSESRSGRLHLYRLANGQ